MRTNEPGSLFLLSRVILIADAIALIAHFQSSFFNFKKCKSKSANRLIKTNGRRFLHCSIERGRTRIEEMHEELLLLLQRMPVLDEPAHDIGDPGNVVL